MGYDGAEVGIMQPKAVPRALPKRIPEAAAIILGMMPIEGIHVEPCDNRDDKAFLLDERAVLLLLDEGCLLTQHVVSNAMWLERKDGTELPFIIGWKIKHRLLKMGCLSELGGVYPKIRFSISKHGELEAARLKPKKAKPKAEKPKPEEPKEEPAPKATEFTVAEWPDGSYMLTVRCATKAALEKAKKTLSLGVTPSAKSKPCFYCGCSVKSKTGKPAWRVKCAKADCMAKWRQDYRTKLAMEKEGLETADL